MNHQGGRMGQFNHSANMQNEINPRESNRTLRLLSSTSSRTGSDQRVLDILSRPNLCPYRESANIIPTNDRNVSAFPHESVGPLLGMNISSSSSFPGSVQRFPGRLFGSSLLHCQRSCDNNITPSNDCSAVVLRNDLHLAAGHGGSNGYSNPNTSLGLSLHSHGPQNQSDSSSSALNTLNSTGISGYTVEEQGGDGSSANTRPLPFKRRSSDYAFREFAIGESSSTGAQAGIPKRRATPFQVNANENENVHISTVCTCPRNGHSGHFETGIGHGATWPISDVQHLSEAGQTESFQSNINLQAGTNPQAFVPPNMLSSTGYRRSDSHVLLPIQPPSFGQYDQHRFFSPVETPVGTICSVHPFENVPHFCESQQASPWTNILRPGNAPPTSLPIYSVMGGSEAMAYFHSQRNIPGNFMLGPQFGWGNWSQNPTNLSLSNGNANILGNFPHPSNQSGSAPGIQLSNARAWVRRLNVHEQYMQLSSGTASHSVAPSTASGTGLVNSISENENRPVARPENQVGGNSQRYFTSSSPNPNMTDTRFRLRDEVRNALEHLRNGGSLRLEDLMILDYSIVLNLLEAQHNSENSAYETLTALEDQVDNVEAGLTEDEIQSNIGLEIFRSITEGTSEKEACCICQEDYVDREEIGRLDCGHRFHLACIKQWLLLKNTCPICKQIALVIIDDEEEEEEEEEEEDDE